MKRRAGALAVALAVLVISGCASLSGGQESLPPAADSSLPRSESSSSEALSSDRSIVSTGTMLVAVESPIGASDDVTAIVTSAGGRVDSKTETEATDFAGASAALTLRIPSADLDSTLNAIGDLGDVVEVSISRDDVTTQVLSVDAQIEALEVSIVRLETLLANASAISDLIELESALTTRQAELDSLKAQQVYLDEQVELATVYLTLREKAQTPAGIPSTFVDGLITGVQALAWVGSVVVVVIGFALPWLGIAALVAAIVVGIVRLVRRKRRVPPRDLGE